MYRYIAALVIHIDLLNPPRTTASETDNMRKTGFVTCVMLIGLASPVLAEPGAMSVATFLAKAEALQAKGFLALGSSDIKLLRGEADAAGKKYRASITADKRAGRAAHSCPPEKAAMNSKQLIAHLQTYPEAARPKTTITAAMFDVYKKHYPCS